MACRHKIKIHELERNPRHNDPNPQNHLQARTLGPGLRRFPRLKGVVGLILDPRAQVSVAKNIEKRSDRLIRAKIMGQRTDHELS